MIPGQTIHLWLTPVGATALEDFGLPRKFPALLFREESMGLWLVPGKRGGRPPLVWIKREYLAAIESPLPPQGRVREVLGFTPSKGR